MFTQDNRLRRRVFAGRWAPPLLLAATLGSLMVPTARADDECGTEQYRYSVRIVESLRADKPGQVRVFAADGSEFSAGQAQWMRGQLHKVAQLCARGGANDRAAAAKALAGVRELLRSRRRDL